MEQSLRKAGEKAFETRLSLIKYFEDASYGNWLMLMLMQLDPIRVTEEQRRNANHIRIELLQSLIESASWVAPKEDCALIDELCADYPGDEIILSNVLSPTGWLYFEEPIKDPVDPETTPPIRAIHWTTQKGDDPGVIHMGFDSDKFLLTLVTYVDTRNVVAHTANLSKHAPVFPMVSAVWVIDSPNGGVLADDAFFPVSEQRKPYVRLMIAFWALVNQRLLEKEVVATDVKKKRIAHALKKRPDMSTEVVVIRKRGLHKRTSGNPEIPEELFDGPPRRKRKYHWYVPPSWRRSRKGDPTYYRVLAHYNGNQDGPFRPSSRVFAPPKGRPAPKDRTATSNQEGT